MNEKLQELSVLTKVVPYLEETIHAKYRKLESDYVVMAEKLIEEKYSGLSKNISAYKAERLSIPIKAECNQRLGSPEERKKWEEEEITLLHNTICSRTYELFPELIYNKTNDR